MKMLLYRMKREAITFCDSFFVLYKMYHYVENLKFSYILDKRLILIKKQKIINKMLFNCIFFIRYVL